MTDSPDTTMAGQEKVTLADALSNVDVLDELPLPDEQPCNEVTIGTRKDDNKRSILRTKQIIILGTAMFYCLSSQL